MTIMARITAQHTRNGASEHGVMLPPRHEKRTTEQAGTRSGKRYRASWAPGRNPTQHRHWTPLYKSSLGPPDRPWVVTLPAYDPPHIRNGGSPPTSNPSRWQLITRGANGKRAVQRLDGMILAVCPFSRACVRDDENGHERSKKPRHHTGKHSLTKRAKEVCGEQPRA